MPRNRLWVFVAVAVMAGTLGAGSAAAPVLPDAARSEHERIVAFWTPERVAQAIPRDFVLDPTTRRFTPSKGKPGGSSGAVLGASWTKGGLVAETTGKVLFAMSGTYYVCSGSVVTDDVGERSIVLTAAHCVYDETNPNPSTGFATNWMFIPNYDAAPTPLTTNGSFCASTRYGCWTAAALAVDEGYAGAGGFNTQATLNDFGFATVGPGGNIGGDDHLDLTVGSQAISFAAGVVGSNGWAFGYPAAKPYSGSDLVYCKGPIGTDPYNANLTYRLGCNMTGGSSGGPWFSPFYESAVSDPPAGTGTLVSVNSYGYSGVKAMHGPVFNGNTQAVFNAARIATQNTVVPIGSRSPPGG